MSRQEQPSLLTEEIKVPLDPVIIDHLIKFQQPLDVMLEGKGFSSINCHRSILEVVPHLRKLIKKAELNGPPIVLRLPDRFGQNEVLAIVNYLYYGHSVNNFDVNKFKELADYLGVDLNPITFSKSIDKYVRDMELKRTDHLMTPTIAPQTQANMLTSTPISANTPTPGPLPSGQIGRPRQDNRFYMVKTPQRIITFYEVTPNVRVLRSTNRYSTPVSRASKTSEARHHSVQASPVLKRTSSNSWLSRPAGGIKRKTTSSRFNTTVAQTPVNIDNRIISNAPEVFKASIKVVQPLTERKSINGSINNKDEILADHSYSRHLTPKVIMPMDKITPTPLPAGRERCPVCLKDFKGVRGLTIHARRSGHNLKKHD